MSKAPGSPAADDHTIHDLHRRFDPEILDSFYAEVLVPSFRPEELQSLDSMAAGLTGRGEPSVLASVAIGPGDEILGGIVAERHPDSEVLLVGYLAVRPDRRGRGIATSLVRRAEAEWHADENVRLALGEVHDPRSWTGVGEDEPVARLRFFERLGARVLAVPFIQPALGPEGRRVRGFLLLALYVDPSITMTSGAEQGIPTDILSRFVRRYYEDTEGAQAPYDPELAWLLDQVEREQTVALLPLSQFELVPTVGA